MRRSDEARERFRATIHRQIEENRSLKDEVRDFLCFILVFVIIAILGFASAAAFGSENFTVHAPTPAIAAEIEQAAEKHRRELSVEWFGSELPKWDLSCHINVGSNAQADSTTAIINYQVSHFHMNLFGTREKILSDILPHEVMHTIFASHFKQPLPRWIDEGTCETVESASNRERSGQKLVHFLRSGRGIAFDRMFAMTEYPLDILPLYAQGHSVATYLIHHKGKREWTSFIADGLKDNDWPRAVKAHFGYENLGQLQLRWLDWVRAGSPQPQGEAVSFVSNRVSYRPWAWNGNQWVPCQSGQCGVPQRPLVNVPQQTRPPAQQQPPVVQNPPQQPPQDQHCSGECCGCDLEELKAAIRLEVQAQLAAMMPEQGNAIVSVEPSPVIPGGLLLHYEDGSTRDMQLPPIRVRQIDKNGDVVLNSKGEREEMNVWLGQNMNLRYLNIDNEQIEALQDRVEQLEAR